LRGDSSIARVLRPPDCSDAPATIAAPVELPPNLTMLSFAPVAAVQASAEPKDPMVG